MYILYSFYLHNNMNIDDDIRIEKNSNGIETYVFDPYNPLNKLIQKEQIETILRRYGVNSSIYNYELYKRAFIHRSYIKRPQLENNSNNIVIVPKPDDCIPLFTKSNERLEFIGDGVLECITKYYLYRRFPKENEGFMTEKKIALVKNESIGRMAYEMGLHEWLIKRGSQYEVTPELHRWLSIYRGVSDATSRSFADALSVSRPVATRAIAPTGSIGILAGTTTGVEPLFAVAYRRRYLTNGTRWKYQYVVDSAAQELIDVYGVKPESIESALDLAPDYERRIKFQADVQDYVDMSISSTINLPEWGSKTNNPDTVKDFANTLAKYAHRLRGFTCYPDGARGGQPLTVVPYEEAVEKLGEEFEEHVTSHDICDISGGGTCGS